jgi:hypothetical protein
MTHNKYVMILAGGLTLMLLSTACASKSKTRTTANQPVRESAVATDRTDQMAVQGRETVAGSSERPVTERPVPSNRTGTPDDRTASDRVVPCADDKGDMTASLDCAPTNRRDDRTGRNAVDDATAIAMANCAYRTDAKGHVIYEDPSCASRYRSQMGSSYENVNWSRESAFYDRYINKAVKHVREAEIAANQGHGPEMMRHAQLSLDQAKEAQRAGNVAGLNEGIIALRETLRHGEATGLPDATGHLRDARINLSRAAGMKPRDTGIGALASTTGTRMNTQARTVKGQLVGDTASSSNVDGGQRYILRGQDGQEVPVILTPDMRNRVKAGDMVEAQVASDGSVMSINPY